MSYRPTSFPEGKMKSKFITNRTNAVKEIEAWVKDGDEYYQRDAVRMSGQLTDNVTEERMLKAKLWELSRERYKFLSQSAYERKLFVDRIHRKSSALRRNVLQLEKISKEQNGGRRVRSSNARLALLDRFDPTKSRDRPKEFKETEAKDGALKGTKSVHFGEDVNITDNPDKVRQQSRPEFAVLSEQNLARRDAVQRSYSASHCRTLPSLADRVSQKSEDTCSHGTIPVYGPALTGNIRTWTTKRTKSGSISSSSSSVNYVRICDPRITKLEGSLSPLYITEGSPDVSSVVREIGSLHIKPKINKETTKPKSTVKIMDYMRAKGLIG